MSTFAKVTPAHIDALKAIVGEAYVLTDEENIEKYAQDETEDLRFPPEVVLKPATTDEVSRIMRLCNEALLPVTPRGGGTGLSGGALAQHGGVLLSTERLNKILDIDERNLQVTTEPSVPSLPTTSCVRL